jgi:hypothetical protein
LLAEQMVHEQEKFDVVIALEVCLLCPSPMACDLKILLCLGMLNDTAENSYIVAHCLEHSTVKCLSVGLHF